MIEKLIIWKTKTTVEKLIIWTTKTTVESTINQIVINLTRRIKYVYIFFLNLFGFIECLPGHTELDCVSKCPYPTYGKNCQGLCNCSKVLCDISRGCSAIPSGNIHLFVTIKLIL